MSDVTHESASSMTSTLGTLIEVVNRAPHDRHGRLHRANAMLQVIASCGRRFFSLRADRPNWQGTDRVSRFEFDSRGRGWFIDKYDERRIYMPHPGKWRGFSEGGTLQSLVRALYRYIMTGDPIPRGHFGPWQGWLCDGDPWGYGDAMQAVREAAVRLGIIPTDQPAPSGPSDTAKDKP